MKTVFQAGACLTPVAIIENAVVVVEDGAITAVGKQGEVELPESCRISQLGDAILAPGFVDIHIHGGAGHDVMEGSADALATIERHLAKHGTTTYFPTTVTAPMDATLKSLERLADAIELAEKRLPGESRARPAGIHLEGPFISHEKRGVHPPEYIQDASVPLFERMWQAARGHVKVMTMAPEIEGAEALIREASRRGVTVSMGHSNAKAKKARQGIAAGGRHATHTFNAMRALDHREPGIIGVVLTDERMTAEMIVDGVHVDPAIVTLFLQAKGPERAVLVTDAISATGMPDGKYQLGSFEVEVRGDTCLSDDGRLAGSVLTLDRAVSNVMSFSGWPLQNAVRLATLNPARVVGLEERRGIIAPGADADFVVLSPEGKLLRTVVAGI